MKPISKNRYVYIIVILFVILLAFGSRYFSDILPKWISEYAGDTLWALTAYLCIGFLLKTLPTLRTATVAVIFSFAIEISQLYHAPWIDTIRNTTLGGPMLGFDFLWSDFLCYLVGIGIGVMFELLLTNRKINN